MEQNLKNKIVYLSIRFPADVHSKIEYIKRKTLLSKQQIIFNSCLKEIESWCKGLMDEELEARTARITQKNLNIQELIKPKYEQ